MNSENKEQMRKYSVWLLFLIGWFGYSFGFLLGYLAGLLK